MIGSARGAGDLTAAAYAKAIAEAVPEKRLLGLTQCCG
jgi:hypothetical protein